MKATCLAPSQQPNSGSKDMIWQSNSSSPPGQSRTESHTLRGSMHSAPERQENWGAIQYTFRIVLGFRDKFRKNLRDFFSINLYL